MLKQENYMEKLEEITKEKLTTAEYRKIKKMSRQKKDIYRISFILILAIVVLLLNMV